LAKTKTFLMDLLRASRQSLAEIARCDPNEDSNELHELLHCAEGALEIVGLEKFPRDSPPAQRIKRLTHCVNELEKLIVGL
jgi:hypothetical protein